MVEKNKLDEDLQGTPVDPTLYHGMIGSPMYLTYSRLDLIYAVSVCVRYQAKPTEKHLNAVKQIFCTSESAQFLGDKLVSWSSKKQKSFAILSTKVEYIALSRCYAQILWMRSQLTDYGFTFNKIPLYCDNKSAIGLCCNNVQQSRAKHIDRKIQLLDRKAGHENHVSRKAKTSDIGGRRVIVDFTISANIPKIFMHQFWYTIKKVQDTNSYELFLANNKCNVIAKLFRKILDICLRVKGVDFTDVLVDDTALTFLIESYQMFIKYSTNQIPPKKSRCKCLKGKKTAKESQETVDVTKKYEPEPKPAKKKTSGKRRVKKKVTLSVDDKIISNDPDAALELAKSINQIEVKEVELARKVHATHARIMTESGPESTKKKSGGRSSKSVAIQDTSSTPKSKLTTSKTKLKGAPSLIPQEQEAKDIIDVFESASDSSVNESEEDNNQTNDRYTVGEGYYAVPPPYTGNFLPTRPNLSFAGLDDSVFKSTINETVTSVNETETSTSKTSMEMITNSGKVAVTVAKQSSPRVAASTSTARNVNTAANRPTVNVTKPTSNVFLVSAVQGNREKDVKSLGCWIWRPTGNVIYHISKDSGSYMLKTFYYVDLQGRLKSAMACLWTSAKVKTVNDDVRIQAIVDGKKVVVNEASIRSDLRLDDAEGTACLPNATIFEELARMGNRFSGVITPLFETMMVHAPEEVGIIPTDTQDTPILTQPSTFQPYKKHKPRRKQRKETEVSQDEPLTNEHIPTPSHDPLPSGKDRLQLNELMEICIKLSDKGRINDQDLFGVHDLDDDEVFVDVTTGENVEQDVTVTEKAKYKGKGIIVEPEKPMKKKDQIALDEEVVRKVEAKMKAKMDKEERVAREKNEATIAMIEEWNDVKTFDDIKKMFYKVYKRVNTFVDMNKEIIEESLKKTQAEVTEGISKRAGEELEQESAKKQKLDEQAQAKITDDDTTELKRFLEIVPEDDDVALEATPLSSKSPTIVDYKIYIERKKSYFKIIMADGNSQNYLTFRTMFKNFNREDLEVLRSIVKERFKKTKTMDDMDNLLFQTLKTMFEHYVEDIIWKYQQGEVKVNNWKLLDSCGVYCVRTKNMIFNKPSKIYQEGIHTSRRQPGTKGSNKGTSSKLRVPDESTIVSATSSEGTGAKQGVPDEEKDITKEKVIFKWGDKQDNEFSNDDVEKDDKDGDVDDKGDDHVSDTQDANDEDVETKSDKDEIYKYKIRVCKDEHVEMKDIEVEESDNDEEKVTDAAKEGAKNTSEAKDDTKKNELPPSSSSLSLSLGFGDQFLKLSFDSSLVSTIKDSADADTTNLPPIQEIIIETLVSTAVPSPQVAPIFSSIQQTPTPTPTQPIKTNALTITTIVPKSDALSAVELRVAKLEKDMFELKIVDHSSEVLIVLQNPDNHQLYHALMEALIKDENVMDKGVTDTVKDHKRKHDDDEEDDN
nr:hypothetical protein [Tanacetum cinerariifolium]